MLGFSLNRARLRAYCSRIALNMDTPYTTVYAECEAMPPGARVHGTPALAAPLLLIALNLPHNPVF